MPRSELMAVRTELFAYRCWAVFKYTTKNWPLWRMQPANVP